MIARITRGSSFKGAARYILDPRRGLDHERPVEIVADAVARGLIGEGSRPGGGHGSARRRVRSARRAAGLRALRRSSYGPQTGR